ncbi:MAG: hypothetical protein Q4P78_02340 [Rothia sp. (in: high G+C Gram-positive bacteria)]|uniref:hypothetical protein n=1 Tax=Rothia sp. (in: high G+C Gram-positive bacteria) TaxID=1885016 RepID=UPI0026DFB6FB|nr:hypothetical protein [Rothia sp. (in: high G+C Gram-positive bacteria)]MDO5750026.1 hypothetical protein [Rothia sp. (in: high G+C Gram-positive bacteria)]
MSQYPAWPLGPMTSDQWMEQFQMLNHRLPTAEEYKAASQRGHISNPQSAAVPVGGAGALSGDSTGNMTGRTASAGSSAYMPESASQRIPHHRGAAPSAPVEASVSMPLLDPLPKREASWRRRTYVWCALLGVVAIAVSVWALFQERWHEHYELTGQEGIKNVHDTSFSWMGLIEHTRTGAYADKMEQGIKAAQASYSYQGYVMLGLLVLCFILLVLSCVRSMCPLRPIAASVSAVSSAVIVAFSVLTITNTQRVNEYARWYVDDEKRRGSTLIHMTTGEIGTGTTAMLLSSGALLVLSLIMLGIMVSTLTRKKS